MPRSIEEILEQADELAARFEDHEPGPTSDATALRAVRLAFLDRAEARALDSQMRLPSLAPIGHSWASIGAMVGTSGEAARQRYGHPATSQGATGA